MDSGIEFLRPYGKWMIIHCVEEAGIDVTGWGFTKEGRPVEQPQSNGAHCYDWSFRSEDGRIMVLCVWFEELRQDVNGRIIFDGNLRLYADNLIRELEKDPRNHRKTIKDPRINRAQHFSSTVELAYLRKIPVRVVIVSGAVRAKEDEGADFDRAIGRVLDESDWLVESFDSETGRFVLVRDFSEESAGDLLGREDEENSASVGGDVFADQFTTEQRSDDYVFNGTVRKRDPSVRRKVLDRARGVCELTGTPGFPMENGGIYLETHHIIPLAEGGPDAVENVIALTATAHRQAHYAENRSELRELCLAIVSRSGRSESKL
jgi:5-methylcytosine-specific restriction protein A